MTETTPSDVRLIDAKALRAKFACPPFDGLMRVENDEVLEAIDAAPTLSASPEVVSGQMYEAATGVVECVVLEKCCEWCGSITPTNDEGEIASPLVHNEECEMGKLCAAISAATPHVAAEDQRLKDALGVCRQLVAWDDAGDAENIVTDETAMDVLNEACEAARTVLALHSPSVATTNDEVAK